MASYEEAHRQHVEYLRYTIKNTKGVSKGYLVKDVFGVVVNRVGRISHNPGWYREFYAKHNRRPYIKELEQLAHKHLQEGFYDEYGFIPPYRRMG